VIRTYGHPARYFSATLVYLHDPRNPTTKWWTMKGSIADQGVINRSTDGRTYGPQTAPRTGPEVPPVVGPHRPDAPASVYDALASSYDARYTRPGDLAENARIASLVTEHFGAYAPTTLDVGCGTGLLLDLRITSPAIYTGVDPSQGMLNHLLAKHPSVDRLVPAPVEEVPLDTLRPTPPSRTRGFDLVASLFGSPSYVAPHVIAALPALLAPGGLLLLMHYRPGYLPDYWAALAPHHRPDPDHVDASYEAARALPATHPALDVTHSTLGHFLVTRAARR
jgi:SAM-dependent methyltransferase